MYAASYHCNLLDLFPFCLFVSCNQAAAASFYTLSPVEPLIISRLLYSLISTYFYLHFLPHEKYKEIELERKGTIKNAFDEVVDTFKGASVKVLNIKTASFFFFSGFKSLSPVTRGRVSYFLAVGS